MKTTAGDAGEKVTQKFDAGSKDFLNHLERAVRVLNGSRDPDLEQEAFVRALQAFRRGRIEHPRALVWKIVHDTVVDHRRSRERSRWDDLDSVPEQLVSSRPEYEVELDRSRRRELVRDAILELGCDIRGPVYLFYLESYPIQTIARIYGKSPSAIKMALHRGRRRLERMFRTKPKKKSRMKRL